MTYTNNFCANADCSGRIQNGSEFFCGDGVVQTASSTDQTKCSNAGMTCKQVTEQYPGAGFNGSFTTGETCDPKDPNILTNSTQDTNKLCDSYLKLNNKTPKPSTNTNSYYGNISCNSSCGITISNSNLTCAYCGDGTIQTSKENCEFNSSGNIISAGGTFDKKCSSGTSTTPSYTTFTVPVDGIYKIVAKGAKGGNGGKGGKCANGLKKSGGSGGNGAYGGIVTAKYYLKAGTVLKLYVGQAGGNGGNGGSNTSTGGTAGTKGWSNSSTNNSGRSGDAGRQGNGKHSGKGGAGGGGATVVKANDTLLVLAYGGGGGGGGEGGGYFNSGADGFNASACQFGQHSSYNDNSNNENGGRGQYGGDGGHYSKTPDSYADDVTFTYQCSYYYPTTYGTDFYYYGSADTSQTNTVSDGSVSVTLEKYAPCITTTCKFQTSTSNYVNCN